MTAPEWPPPMIARDELGPLAEPLSTGSGQSTGVHPLERHPRLLAKFYSAPRRCGELDDLIALRSKIDGADRAVLEAGTSWPVARISDESGELALGCVIPRAPERFHIEYATASGEKRERYLDLDWLPQNDAYLAQRGIAAPDRAARLEICRNIVAIAELLERHELVYSDWNYSNAFWCATDRSVFVIDVDGCGVRSVPNIRQPQWDDPLTPADAPADPHTDRYRVGLLVLRCLTGTRDTTRALHELADPDLGVEPRFREALLDVLLARRRALRPKLATLRQVLEGAPHASFKQQRLPLPELPPRPGGSDVPAADPAPGNDPPSAAPRRGLSRGALVSISAVLLLIALVVAGLALAPPH